MCPPPKKLKAGILAKADFLTINALELMEVDVGIIFQNTLLPITTLILFTGTSHCARYSPYIILFS